MSSRYWLSRWTGRLLPGPYRQSRHTEDGAGQEARYLDHLYLLDVRTGPDGQTLRTACDYAGHEERCSALTLGATGESASTFWSARDLDNE